LAHTDKDDWLGALDRRILGWLWRPGRPRGGLGKLGNRVLQVAYLSVRSSQEDRLAFQAGALTFITLLGLVPALAISFALAKGLGFSNALQQILINNEFTASQTEIFKYIIRYVENTQVGTLGVVGFILLLAALILALSNMEQVFNRIWEVSAERPWLRKVTDYLSVLVICPLFMLAATGAWAGFLSHERVRWLLDVAYVGQLAQWGLSMGPLVLLAAAFIFFYLFLPNTRVPLLSALLAGVTAAGLWWAVQSVYIAFQVGVARYNAIYGGFASLPLFMIWLHVSWTVVLYGAELAHAHYVCRHGPLPNFLACSLRPIEREQLALSLMFRVGLRFYRGDTALTMKQLSREMAAPAGEVQKVTEELQAAGLLAETAPGDPLLPGRSLETIAVADVLEAVHGAKLGGEGGREESVSAALAELVGRAVAASREAVAGISLLELIKKVPASQENLPGGAATAGEPDFCVKGFSPKL